MESKSNLIYKIKETAKHSFIFVLGSGVQSALNFVLLPIITKNLLPAEYGIYSLIVMIGALASAVFYLGGTSAMSRFFFDQTDADHRIKVFSACFIISLVGFFGQVGFGLLFSGTLSNVLFGSERFRAHIMALLVASGLTFIFTFLLLRLRIERRSVLFSVLNVFVMALNFVVTFILLDRMRFGIASPIMGLLLSNLLGCILLTIGLRKSFDFSVDLSRIESYLRFGLPAILISLAAYLMDWVDRIVLNTNSQQTEVGIYSFGCRVGSLILALYVQPFGMVWSSIRWEYARDKDTVAFFSQVSKLYTFVGLAAILCLSIFMSDILSLLSRNEEYNRSIAVIPFVLLAHLAYGYVNIWDFGIYLHKKLIIYVFVIAGGILLNVALNVILLPKFGTTILAANKLIAFGACAGMIHFVSNKYYAVKYDVPRIFFSFVLILATIEVATSLHLQSAQRLTMNIFLMVFLSTAWIFILFRKGEISALKQLLGVRWMERQ